MTTLIPLEKTEFKDTSGIPYSGAKLYIYISDTNTPIPTFGDREGKLVYNSYPVTLDYSGKANVWVSPEYTYRIVLRDPLDRIVLFKADGITGGDVQQTSISVVPLPVPGGAAVENFISLPNGDTTTIPKGSPVYSDGFVVRKAIANSPNVKRVVGLAAETILPSSIGVIQVDGILEMSNIEWQIASNEVGGIANSNYWISAVQIGRLTSFPVTQSSTEVWSLKIGYGVSPTKFKIEIQPSVKL